MDYFWTVIYGYSSFLGKVLETKESLSYLGATIHNSGKIDSELSRRLGLATQDFKSLRSIWNHTCLSCLEKFAIYRSCVCSKLLYGLQSAWLSKAQRAKLDGFHARCVRRIIGILPSYWSRILNRAILERVDAIPLSKLLLEQQLLYFGKLFRLPLGDCRRRMIFDSQSSALKTRTLKRRRGRPRANWAIEVDTHVNLIIGCQRWIMNVPLLWKQLVRQYCRS